VRLFSRGFKRIRLALFHAASCSCGGVDAVGDDAHQPQAGIGPLPSAASPAYGAVELENREGWPRLRLLRRPPSTVFEHRAGPGCVLAALTGGSRPPDHASFRKRFIFLRVGKAGLVAGESLNDQRRVFFRRSECSCFGFSWFRCGAAGTATRFFFCGRPSARSLALDDRQLAAACPRNDNLVDPASAWGAGQPQRSAALSVPRPAWDHGPLRDPIAAN